MAFTIVHEKDDIFLSRKDISGVQEYSDYTSQWVEDPSLPQGGMDVVIIDDFDMDEYFSQLIFYSHHQCVNVYIGNELVYVLKPSKNNFFGKTPGNNWINVPVYRSDIGKTIKIQFVPVYASSIGDVGTIYVGSRHLLFLDLFKQNILTYGFSGLIFLIGFSFFCVAVYNYLSGYRKVDLLYLGAFAMWLGIWKIYDVNTVEFFHPYSIGASQFTLICMNMVMMPCIVYINSVFHWVNERLNNLVAFSSVFLAFCCLLLHMFRIADFRESLLFVHIQMIAVVCLGTYYMVVEIKNYGFTRGIKLTLLCVLVCVVGAGADLIVFYSGAKGLPFDIGIFGFTIYVFVLGIFNVNSTIALIKQGRLARRFEKMAYTDALTGLHSRQAYKDYLLSVRNLSGFGVLMCDLNDLKLCNDTFGHEVGDHYIVESAKIIKAAAGDEGFCCRLGGDEFCVLFNGKDYDSIKKVADDVQQGCRDYAAREDTRHQPAIACGVAVFDSAMDLDYSDTLRRADETMYRNKHMLKENTN